ncbi:MAG: response regulator [Rhodobacterales bacterium]|nr:response regulator [Rhodobacterales bacterium]
MKLPSDWRDVLWTAPVWLGLALVMWITLSIAVQRPGEGVRSLRGTWSAEYSSMTGTEPVLLELPGLLIHQGIPTTDLVIARKTVKVDSTQLHALWLDAPLYSATVRWDGLEIARLGDPTLEGDAYRKDGSLLAVLPPSDPNVDHILELVLRGDYGRGGVYGRILFGPVNEVVASSSAHETQRLSLALGLSLLAFLPLTVATRRPLRPAYIFYGLFACCLATLSYGQSDISASMLPNALQSIRLQRLAEGPLAALLIAFMGSFLYGKTSPAQQWFLRLGLVSSAAGLFWPASSLYTLESLQDVTLLVGIPWFILLLYQGVKLRIPGIWIIVILAGFPSVIGVIPEIFHSHGMRDGTSHLFEASLLLVGGCGAALILRDAKTSARHERLIARSVDAMIGVNVQGLIHDANPAAMGMLGADCLNRNIFEFVDAQDHPLMLAHIQRGVKSGDRADFQLADSGGIEVESLATPLERELALLVIRDVTVRKNIDRGMLQAARHETVVLLLGGIAHDFNNMLGTLLAHVGFLQSTVDNPKILHRMGRMENTIARASQLTRRLLTITRGSSTELGPTNLHRVCRDAIELIEPTLPENVSLAFTIPDSLPPAYAEGAELEQVLVNLMVNARDAVEGGGTIHLVVHAFQLTDGARGICIMVEDDGPGVPMELREDVFKPFVTTKGRGTGLGLAVASQVAKDHHGRIWYEDRPGGGARFLLALRHADAVVEAPTPLPQGRKVLLVEDKRVLLEEYSRALTAAGYDVTAYEDPTLAAAWLMASSPDVLVTDVVMEGLSGIDLATLCSHRYPKCPVLLVSGFIPDESMAMNGWHRLHKPVRAARLVATVGRICRRAERAERGEPDITCVTYLFPSLEDMTAAAVGLDTGR